jgi:hypothetical protein
MPDTTVYDTILILIIKRGDKYLNINYDSWHSSVIENEIKILGATCKPEKNKNLSDYSNVDGIIFDMWPLSSPLDIIIEPLELTFSLKRSVGDIYYNKILFFQNISLSDPDPAYTNYRASYLYKEQYKITGTQRGTDDASLTAGLNNLTWSKNENTFLPSANGPSDPPSFPHMFNPQRFLDQRVERIAGYSQANANDYNVRFLYGEMGGTGRVRILSKSFYMSDDEYRIIFAQSPVLNA